LIRGVVGRGVAGRAGVLVELVGAGEIGGDEEPTLDVFVECPGTAAKIPV
jgi:hypothetical protein